MLFLGLDPGKSGGIVVLLEGGALDRTLALERSTEADVAIFLAGLSPLERRLAFCEKISPFPGQGASSRAKLSESYGFLRGVLTTLGFERRFVAPQVWQRAMGCLSGGYKRVTKARAEEIWPGEKWTHALADAALIAEYGRRQWRAQERTPGDV